MVKPKITVYIPSRNYGRFLEQAIESVLRQTVDNWELLLIDDNSTDNTRDVMNLYQGDQRIRMFHTNGIGLPAICNLALRESRGDYLIRLDGDDMFDENILLVLSNHLDRCPDCAMVFPDYYLIDEWGDVFAHEKRERVYAVNHVFDDPANGACCMIRESVLEELGGYREDLKAQDGYDLWNKLIGRYKIANVNLPLFYYRRHSQNLTNRSHHILSARRQIKHDNVLDKLQSFRPITAVIPCRRNYDFCPNVWNEKVLGKTLLQVSIEKCLKSDIIDHVIIASDNPDVQQVMSLFDDSRLSFFRRRPEETTRSRSLVPTLEQIIRPLDPEWRGLFVIAYLQAPFVTTNSLEEAIFTLILNEADCAFGVEEIRESLFKRTPHGLQPLNPPRGFSTDFDMIYRESNVSLASRSRNLRIGSLTGPLVVNFTVCSGESFYINSDQTLQIAGILAANRNRERGKLSVPRLAFAREASCQNSR